MTGRTPAEETRWIEGKARSLGFDLCGVAPVESLAELAHLPEWLARGYAGEMKYMHDPRRADPRQVLEGARSLIAVALNYNTPEPPSTDGNGGSENGSPRGWISRYAWGADYHDVLGKKLEALLAGMRAEIRKPFDARAYVDTGPILERVAAKYAGLGWLAKNTCLINQKLGSWLFLGVIVTTLELAPSASTGESLPRDLCGSCTRCLDACPTQAFPEPYVLDARRCISYLTIELRGAIAEELRPEMGRHVFGCDICQDVCPWNRKGPVTPLLEFQPREVDSKQPRDPETGKPENDGVLFAPELEWLASLSQREFSEMFRGSAVKRAKWRGLIRNACVALGNSAVPRGSAAYAHVTQLLDRLAHSEEPLIAEHARWALARRLAAN
jgi:epoxyqueuosine reductase